MGFLRSARNRKLAWILGNFETGLLERSARNSKLWDLKVVFIASHTHTDKSAFTKTGKSWSFRAKRFIKELLGSRLKCLLISLLVVELFPSLITLSEKFVFQKQIAFRRESVQTELSQQEMRSSMQQISKFLTRILMFQDSRLLVARSGAAHSEVSELPVRLDVNRWRAKRSYSDAEPWSQHCESNRSDRLEFK